MDDLTTQILYAIDNSGRTLAEFLRSIDEGDGAAFDFLDNLIQDVIFSHESGE
jgi:hypothetical protein